MALALGGKASRLAQQIPPAVLGRNDGLPILIHVLEGLFQAEEQEITEDTLDVFERFGRGRGQSIPDFLADWDYWLFEVRSRGWQANELT